jgi:two-component system chemotaxis response regulator CheB
MGAAVRVLLVDGDARLRQQLSQLLGEYPAIEVVGAAANGRTALPRLLSYRPDVLVLDLGAAEEALALLAHGIGARTVALATAAVPAAVLAEAAQLGVAEVVRKPDGEAEASVRALAAAVVPRLLRLGAVTGRAPLAERAAPATASAAAFATAPTAASASVPEPALRSRTGRHSPRVVAIGVSTGGPKALASILPELPADFPLPILIVQHMPPLFTASLAESLAKVCRLPVREAQHGEPVRGGQILIAPGGRHLRAVRRETGEVLELTEDPPVCSCRPSVDYLFHSLRGCYGGAVLGVMLTGMGEDGWVGCQALHDAGAILLAQDEASCTVFGMPRGPIRAGIAEAVPLAGIAAMIQQKAKG